MLTLSDCKQGTVYRLSSRNLDIGVFDGLDGFIGIREKLGSRFLFKEYYNSGGNLLGTVIVLEEICVLPKDIEITSYMPYSLDLTSNRQVIFGGPIKEGGSGWYYIDTGESSTDIYPIAVENKKIFDFLDKLVTL